MQTFDKETEEETSSSEEEDTPLENVTSTSTEAIYCNIDTNQATVDKAKSTSPRKQAPEKTTMTKKKIDGANDGWIPCGKQKKLSERN